MATTEIELRTMLDGLRGVLRAQDAAAAKELADRKTLIEAFGISLLEHMEAEGVRFRYRPSWWRAPRTYTFRESIHQRGELKILIQLGRSTCMHITTVQDYPGFCSWVYDLMGGHRISEGVALKGSMAFIVREILRHEYKGP